MVLMGGCSRLFTGILPGIAESLVLMVGVEWSVLPGRANSHQCRIGSQQVGCFEQVGPGTWSNMSGVELVTSFPDLL